MFFPILAMNERRSLKVWGLVATSCPPNHYGILVELEAPAHSNVLPDTYSNMLQVSGMLLTFYLIHFPRKGIYISTRSDWAR